jgi:hypothetical protein
MDGTYTSQADEHFFGAIGRLTIAWGYLELGLDCVIFEIHRAFRGNEIAPELPRSLSRKLAYLRKWAKKMVADDEAVAGYHSLLESIERSARTRHDLIHGVVTEMAEGSGEAEYARLMRNPDGYEIREIAFTTTDILQAATEAQRLSGKTLLWATEIQKFVSEQIQRYVAHNQS